MRYIGIDQSYSGFGAVVLHENGKHEDHLGVFPVLKYPNTAARLLAIDDWLCTVVGALPAEETCMEGYANAAKFGREQAGELGGLVKTHFWLNHGIMPRIVQPTSLKMYVTGKGTAKKNEMLLGVYKRWGVEFTNDNLADAYALAQFSRDIARINIGDTDGLTKVQQKALYKVLDMPIE